MGNKRSKTGRGRKENPKAVVIIPDEAALGSDSHRNQVSGKSGIMSRLLALLCRDLPPRRIIHSRVIYQTPLDQSFNINIELSTCVHGYLSPTMHQRASLLVFNVQLVCIGRRGTFSRALMNIDFEDMAGDAPAKATILAHAPFQFAERQNEKGIEVTQTARVETVLSAQIELMGGKGGAKRTTTSETVSTGMQNYYRIGTSATAANAQGRISNIWWNVKKSSDPNARDDAGIAANYRFAVLVTRESNAEYRIGLKLDVDVANMGIRHRLKGGSSKITVKGESGGLDIDPRTHYEGNCNGVSRMNLGRLKRDGRMAKLASLV